MLRGVHADEIPQFVRIRQEHFTPHRPYPPPRNPCQNAALTPQTKKKYLFIEGLVT